MDDEWDIVHELKHEEMPGYRKIFYIVFAIGIIYLGLVFFL